ncbi:hypothetical protein ASZ90_000935 [hydrocarbon metagenome]|uniref:Uncharacterized protein n=1 Tax=hydrocarbon metagenome TaxID=938273 RepID=A0A0W8G9I5_9ZZZZ
MAYPSHNVLFLQNSRIRIAKRGGGPMAGPMACPMTAMSPRRGAA